MEDNPFGLLVFTVTHTANQSWPQQNFGICPTFVSHFYSTTELKKQQIFLP